METRTSLQEISTDFERIVGFDPAAAKISWEGAKKSAGILVDIKERMDENKVQPIDIYSAIIATSQLLNWWKQRDYQMNLGMLGAIEDIVLMKKIKQDESTGNLTAEQKNDLIRSKYVADPRFGAANGMKLIRDLKQLFP